MSEQRRIWTDEDPAQVTHVGHSQTLEEVVVGSIRAEAADEEARAQVVV